MYQDIGAIKWQDRMLCYAKSPQSCLTLCDPIEGSHQLPRPWDSPGKNTGVGSHFLLQCMKVKSESEVAQSCPTPSDPMDCSPPGSSIHGTLQARVLEWGAIAFSRYVLYSLVYTHSLILGLSSCNQHEYWETELKAAQRKARSMTGTCHWPLLQHLPSTHLPF